MPTRENPAFREQRACPDAATHTPFPSGDWDQIGSHAWSERMERTHVQRQCPTCGYWVIWERKP